MRPRLGVVAYLAKRIGGEPRLNIFTLDKMFGWHGYLKYLLL
jgi:hypothetical protein